MVKLTAVAGACLLVAGAAYAQDPGPSRDKIQMVTAQDPVAVRVPLERNPVKGAPYSADTVTENTQSLADGNRIARKVTGRVYRDGEGRTRREEDHPDGTVTISIVDPVAGVSYRLDPQAHVAWKTPAEVSGLLLQKMRAESAQVEQRRKVEAEPRARAGGAGTNEATVGVAYTPRGMVTNMVTTSDAGSLEKKTIDGIPVEGHKVTSTIPAGQIGNDLPLTITSEEWTSPDLKVLISTRYSDPRMGESSYRLTNVVRAEPDPSLFQVPPGYTIKETGIRREQPE